MFSPPPGSPSKCLVSSPSSMIWTNRQRAQQSNSSAFWSLGDDKTQQQPSPHKNLAWDLLKQQPMQGLAVTSVGLGDDVIWVQARHQNWCLCTDAKPQPCQFCF